MPTFRSFSAFGAEFDKVAGKLDSVQRREITHEMGEAGQKIADRFAGRDLGSDRAFSGWKRGNPIALGTHLKPARNDATLLLPTFPGGWTTATAGRHRQGGVGLFQGPGVNPRTGATRRRNDGTVTKVRARKAKRWNGRTAPMNTATDAAKEMERDLPVIASRAYRAVLVKHFDVT